MEDTYFTKNLNENIKEANVKKEIGIFSIKKAITLAINNYIGLLKSVENSK